MYLQGSAYPQGGSYPQAPSYPQVNMYPQGLAYPPGPPPEYAWTDSYVAYPPGVLPMPATSPYAVAAMIAGILSLFMMLPGPVAVGLGIAGLRQVRANPQSYGGSGAAITGIVTGAIGCLMLLLVLLVAWAN